MTFLAPTALIGILLLALPIIVHLFKPRKMRATPFSSLRWLKQAHQRLSRRIQWHQWFLFLLRAGCILLLVLALAKPLVGLWSGQSGVDRFLVVDVSRSMAYSAPGLPTPLERAQELAQRLASQTRPGDRLALVLVGGSPRLAAPLSADVTSVLNTLRTVQAEAGEAPLTSTLPLLRSLAGAAGERQQELVFFTANLQASWQAGAVQDLVQNLPTAPRVQVIDVGPGSAANGWISNVRLIPLEDRDRLLRVEIGCVGDLQRQRTVRLTGLAGVNDEVQPVSLTPGQVTRVDFKIPRGVELQGQAAEVRLEPADAMPSDDHYFLNLDAPWSLKALIVQPEAPREEAPGPGLFLFNGLEALAATHNYAVTTTVRSAKSVAAHDCQKADLIFLAGAPELTDAVLEALEQRVRGGAGLVVYLGRNLNLSFYNEKLHKAVQPAAGLLPVPIFDKIQGGNPGILTSLRWTHPVLAPLGDPVLSDLPQCRFHYFVPLATPKDKDTLVLARLDETAPALIERPFGAGRVLVWNTTADDSWADLPRSRAFVPLLDRMIGYLAGGAVRRQFVVGDPIALPLPTGVSADHVKVTNPVGTVVPHRLRLGSGLAFLHLEDVKQAGIYRVEVGNQPEKSVALAVNAGRGQSPMQPMDGPALENLWAPAECAVTSAEQYGQRLEEEAMAWPLWPMLMLLAGLLLLAETIYVHRLCPRRNPSVVQKGDFEMRLPPTAAPVPASLRRNARDD